MNQFLIKKTCTLKAEVQVVKIECDKRKILNYMIYSPHRSFLLFQWSKGNNATELSLLLIFEYLYHHLSQIIIPVQILQGTTMGVSIEAL